MRRVAGRKVRRVLLGATGLLLGMGIALPFAAVWGTLRRKPSHPLITPAAVGLPYASVRFCSSDGVMLAGWLVPAQGEHARGVVVLSHGVDGNREQMLPEASMLHRHGYACLLYDSRARAARGESGGAGCTLGVRETDDMISAVRYARAQPGLAKCSVAVLGISLGGAVAIMAGARDPEIRAVVAESPFSRLDRAVDNHFRAGLGFLGPPVAWPAHRIGEAILRIRTRDVSPEDEIGRIAPRAVLLIQDGADRMAPPEETRRLLSRAGEPKQLLTVPGAGHVQAIETAPSLYERVVAGFLDAHLAASPSARAHTGGKPAGAGRAR